MEMIAVCAQNHTEPISTFCGHNAELLIIKAGGTYLPLGFKDLILVLLSFMQRLPDCSKKKK
jgi:hypothetical protein